MFSTLEFSNDVEDALRLAAVKTKGAWNHQKSSTGENSSSCSSSALAIEDMKATEDATLEACGVKQLESLSFILVGRWVLALFLDVGCVFVNADHTCRKGLPRKPRKTWMKKRPRR